MASSILWICIIKQTFLVDIIFFKKSLIPHIEKAGDEMIVAIIGFQSFVKCFLTVFHGSIPHTILKLSSCPISSLCLTSTACTPIKLLTLQGCFCSECTESITEYMSFFILSDGCNQKETSDSRWWSLRQNLSPHSVQQRSVPWGLCAHCVWKLCGRYWGGW